MIRKEEKSVRRWKSDNSLHKEEENQFKSKKQNSWQDLERPKPMVEESSGWGLNILKNHQRKQSQSNGPHYPQKPPRGSFVDFLPLSELSLAMLDQKTPPTSHAKKSDSSDQNVIVTSQDVASEQEEKRDERTSITSSMASSTFSNSTTRVVSSHASSSSIGSSKGSSDDIDSYFQEDLEDKTSEGSVGRVAYKRGLSQRRIRGSSGEKTLDSIHQCGSEETEVIAKESNSIQRSQETRTDATESNIVVQVQKSPVEQLFLAVKNNDEATMKSLHSGGVSLESIDKNGMTPLVMSCLDGSLFNMVRALIQLGANVHYYRTGLHAGYPLHHAAKRGHNNIVELLLSHGAEALAVNDDGQTALDMARIRGHASAVRVIEDWIALFKGILRQITDNAGSQIMKRIWAVVLPSGSSRHELVIYSSRKVPMPEAVILLGSVTSDIQEPDYVSSDTSLIITDKVTKTKFKFFSHEHGDKKQILNFYSACKGIPQEKNRVPRSSIQVKHTQSEIKQVNQGVNEGLPTRSRTEKPSSKKNVIFPEESLDKRLIRKI